MSSSSLIIEFFSTIMEEFDPGPKEEMARHYLHPCSVQHQNSAGTARQRGKKRLQ